MLFLAKLKNLQQIRMGPPNCCDNFRWCRCFNRRQPRWATLGLLLSNSRAVAWACQGLAWGVKADVIGELALINNLVFNLWGKWGTKWNQFDHKDHSWTRPASFHFCWNAWSEMLTQADSEVVLDFIPETFFLECQWEQSTTSYSKYWIYMDQFHPGFFAQSPGLKPLLQRRWDRPDRSGSPKPCT